MAKMTLDSKQILENVRALSKDKRQNHTFRFREDLYQKFKKKCGKESATKVLEQLMKMFIGE